MTLFVYDHILGRFDAFEGLNICLPYLNFGSVTLAQFVGNLDFSDIAWTDRRVLEAYDRMCSLWGNTIHINNALRRIKKGMVLQQSAHYAGLALDLAKGMDSGQRERLRKLAVSCGEWGFVEPAHLAPTWVHVQYNIGTNSYPSLTPGDCGVHVFVLQDILTFCGFPPYALTGTFDISTKDALKRFQCANNLAADARASRSVWNVLIAQANKRSVIFKPKPENFSYTKSIRPKNVHF